MDSTRVLLAGIAATLLATCGITAAIRSRSVAESPLDLARQAVAAGSGPAQARAATRLAALAGQPHPQGDADVIAGLRDALDHGQTSEVRAAAVVGLARTGDRGLLPLVVAAIEDHDPLVAGRAVAAAQHLLGVRYGVEDRPLDREECRRVAAMARADMAALDGPGRAWWESHTVQGARW